MWISVLAILLLAMWLAVRLGFVPPLRPSMLIRIREGLLEVRRGTLRPYAREHVTEILRNAGVSSGFIAITFRNRVAFSRAIPSEIRQRLRNVLLNQ